MGRVIQLEAWKRDRRLVVVSDVGGDDRSQARRHKGSAVPLRRVEEAIARLEPLVRRGSGRIGSRVETELLAITGAVAAGRIPDAAARAERLAERLEHPSSQAVH